MSEDLAEKQKFLSTQILQANFDPEQFQDFMVTNSNKPLDLNQWTFSELKKIVSQFKKKNQRQQQQMKNNRRSVEMVQKKQEKIQLKEQKQQQNQNFQNDKQQTISIPQTVNTSLYRHFAFRKKTSLPQLYVLIHMQKKSFDVKVVKHLKSVPNNIFKSSYIDYVIETSEKWQVKRRFTDFLWLHKNLVKAYQGLPIPPIPQKTTVRSFDQKHIRNRIIIFQNFLNSLTRMPQVCSDPILQIFMRADNDYFSQAKKKYQANCVQNYQTCTVQSIWGDEQVLPGIASVDRGTLNFYTNIRNSYNSTSVQLNNLQQSLKKASFDSLNAAQYFEVSQSTMQTMKTSKILGVMQQFCQKLSQNLADTAQFISKSLTNIWTYESMCVSNYVSYISKIRKQQEQIAHRYKTVMMKVSDSGPNAMVSSMQPSKGIKDFQIAKQQYKIKLSYTMRQIQRFQKQSLKRISNQWGDNLKTFIRLINNWAIDSVDQLTKALTIQQGKQLVEVQYIK